MSNYVILLPPSEGKNKGGDMDLKLSFKEIDVFRAKVLADLKSTLNFSNNNFLMKTFKVKQNKLEEIKSFDFDNSKCLRSIDRFSGVMFKSIDFESMNSIQKSNFSSNIVFVDALFGFLKADDMIFDYKLMMGTKLEGLKTDRFWKDILVLSDFDFFKGKLVVDLLPSIHRSSVNFNSTNFVQINFFEKVNSKLKNVGHKSKKLKGEFVRFLCLNENIDLDYVKSFEHSEGYKFCINSSDLENNILCFVK